MRKYRIVEITNNDRVFYYVEKRFLWIFWPSVGYPEAYTGNKIVYTFDNLEQAQDLVDELKIPNLHKRKIIKA